MKQALTLLLLLLTSTMLHAQIAPPLGAIPEAQQRVWELNGKLNDARLNLRLLDLDWNRDKLSRSLADAQAKGVTANIEKLQQQIANIDHQKDVEKQRHDLFAQYYLAQRQGDQSKIDALKFQLKESQ